jgi:hypothetical protein
LSLCPSDADAAERISIALSRLGKGVKAIDWIVRARRINPQSTRLMDIATEISISVGDPDASNQAMRGVVLSPSTTEAWGKLVRSLITLRQYSQAGKHVAHGNSGGCREYSARSRGGGSQFIGIFGRQGTNGW